MPARKWIAIAWLAAAPGLAAEAAVAVPGEGLAKAQRAIAEREYEATPSGGGIQAPNRAHGLRIWFEPTGVRVHTRMSAVAPPLAELRLASVGRGRSALPIGRGELASRGARVEIRRPGILEWYLNSPAGLEQGFTLDERPPGRGRLWLELRVSGARAALHGDAVRLRSAAGRSLLYGKLEVRDALGKPLAARLGVPATDRIRLIVDDRDAAYPVVVDPLLTKSADTRLEADQADALLGGSVAGAGDVNGDGFGDLIVGASLFDSGQTNEGAAFVFLGSAAGIDDGGPGAAARLESDQGFAELGSSVAGAGDVDGDGYDDVIVGAPRYSSGSGAEGAAFVFLGGPGGIPDGNPASAAARLESDQEDALLGTSVAGAGDVNGDGFADVLVGAPLFDAGDSDEGAAFVFHGGAAGVVDSTAAGAATRLESNQPNAELGRSVAGAGDLDADGFADVIVGAPVYDTLAMNEGAAFVFHGAPGGIPSGGPADADARLEAESVSLFGQSVAGAGDGNGDGYADLVVGAPSFDVDGVAEGAAFVFLGGAAGVGNQAPGTAAAQLASDSAASGLGQSVAGLGDVDGDGYADVGVGAPRYGAGDWGALLVFRGGSLGVQDGTPSSAEPLLQGEEDGDLLGTSVAGAGDVDGDGYADLVAGATGYSDGDAAEGAALVFRGGARGVPSSNPASASSLVEGDQDAQLGTSVASAGDVNGDGFGDLVVGAPGYDAGEADEGAAFVLLGGEAGVSEDLAEAARLESNASGARLGSSVAGAGDVDGDGFGDVIVGAPRYETTTGLEGAVFVFGGGATGIPSGGPAGAATTLLGGADAVLLGERVAGVGDLNGDGYGDVAVSARRGGMGTMSEILVFMGSQAGIADGGPADAGARLQKPVIGQIESVAGAGDVNGDGFADLIVGDHNFFGPELLEGAVFLFYGSAAGLADASFAEAPTKIEGGVAEGRFGHGVAGAGDVDGDGFADVIVGASHLGTGEEGDAFVFHGGPGGLASGNASGADAQLTGEESAANFGQSVAGAGDVNGDGFGDVLVAAPQQGPLAEEGVAFLFLGGPTGVSASGPDGAAARFSGGEPQAALGRSVAGAGDVDGDGHADVVVGASFLDAAVADAGAALVFLGNDGAPGRPVRVRQLRGDGSGASVEPWGGSGSPNGFRAELVASHPQGTGRVRARVEACPPGAPFGDADCTTALGAELADLGPSLTEAVLAVDVVGLAPATLYHWRARVEQLPPRGSEPVAPAHGPWRRPQAQAGVADVRTAAAVVLEPDCPASPAPACIAAGRARLSVNEAKAGKEKLAVKLSGLAAATTQAAFGDPVGGDTRFDLCLYGAAGDLVAGLAVERAGALCGAKQKPCWKARKTKGYAYEDPLGAAAGVRRLTATSGEAGKGKLALGASNAAKKGQTALPLGIASALAGAGSAVVQLHASDAECFSAQLGTVSRADGASFKARTP